MWAGGIGTFYPPEFTEELREIVRERDGRKCALCGVSEEGCVRKLDVHHVDYDRDNNEIGNLVSLCHPCHATTSGPMGRDEWTALFEGR